MLLYGAAAKTTYLNIKQRIGTILIFCIHILFFRFIWTHNTISRLEVLLDSVVVNLKDQTQLIRCLILLLEDLHDHRLTKRAYLITRIANCWSHNHWLLGRLCAGRDVPRMTLLNQF